MDGQSLFFSLFFSIIGMGYFSYGRKDNPIFLFAGVLLMVYPYFISSMVWLIIVGILLCVFPFLLRM